MLYSSSRETINVKLSVEQFHVIRNSEGGKEKEIKDLKGWLKVDNIENNM